MSAVVARRLVLLHLRSRWLFVLLWLVALGSFIGAAPSAYPATYPNESDLVAVGEQMSDTLGIIVMYGNVPKPLTYASWVAWELLPFALLLGSVMMIFFAVSTTRGLEDRGLAEVLRTTGISAYHYRLAGLIATILVALALGLVVTGALASNVPSVPGMTVQGSVLAGAVVTVVTGLFGLLAIFFGEVFGSARAARGAALGVLAIAFILKVTADIGNIPALRWITPLAWRDLAAPLTENHWWVLPYGLMFALAAALSVVLSRRDLHGQWVPARPTRVRVTGFGSWSLWWKLHGKVTTWWSLTILGVAVGYYSLTGEMIKVLQNSTNTSALLTLMLGEKEIISLYTTMMSTLVGILLGCFALTLVLTLHRAETHGHLTTQLLTGAPRTDQYLRSVGLVLTIIAMVTVVAALLGATAALQDSRVSADSFGTLAWSLLDLLPALLACTGIGFALIGMSPRLSGWVWLPVAYSGMASLVGELLRLPDWMLKASVFAWGPHDVDHWAGAGVLIAIGLIGLVLGGLRLRARDLA